MNGYAEISNAGFGFLPRAGQLLNGLRPVSLPPPARLPKPLPLRAPKPQRAARFRQVLQMYAETIQAPVTDAAGNRVMGQLEANGGLFQVRLPDGTTRSVGVTAHLTTRGVFQVRVGATAAQAGSGLGGAAYRAIYAAAVNSGMRIYNDVLFTPNKARLAVNRLKAMLQGGQSTGDLARAASVLAVNPQNLWFSSWNHSSMPQWVRDRGNPETLGWTEVQRNREGLKNLIDRFLHMTEFYLPTQGQLTLNADGSIQTPDGPKQYGELIEWLDVDNRAPWTAAESSRNHDPIGFVRATQTPGNILLAALLRSWQKASTAREREAVIQAALQADTNFFSRDDAVDSSLLGLGDTPIDVEVGPDSSPTGGDSPSKRKTLAKGAITSAGASTADNLTSTPSEDRRRLSPRGSAPSLITDIANDTPVAAASVTRELMQARSFGQAKTAFGKIMDKLNETFHTNLTPVNSWLNSIINMDTARLEQLGEDTRNALHAAPVIRDYTVTEIENRGGRKLTEALASLAAKAGITEEMAVRHAGYLATAYWVPQANQRLIDRRAAALQEAIALHDKEPTEATQAAVSEAQAELLSFIAAVNGNVRTELSADKLAGGMNNAHAAAMRAAIESKYDKGQLDAVREALYDMNAAKLALDIESGKTDVDIAAQFLGLTENKEAIKKMHQLHSEGRNASGENALELSALRDEVSQLVRTEYVPLSGDPLTAVDADMLDADSAAPNIGQNRRMEGRTSISNDGITESYGQINKSANYAGWRPFQESVARLYNGMSMADRHKAGISRGTIGQPGTQITRNSLILRTGDTGAVFTLPEDVMGAIRKTNVDDVSGLWLGLGNISTRKFAYAATQLNPTFAPTNWLRDVWERSEIVRKFDYVRDTDGNKVDMNRVARSMLVKGLLNPSIFAATARFAAGRPAKDTAADRAIRAIARDGGLSTYGDQFSPDRSSLMKRIARQRTMNRRGMQSLRKLIDVYNKTFDLVSSTALYMAMQEAGVASKTSAAVALDSMNFRKKGTAMPQISVLYAFAQPAVTSGVNLVSSLYDRKTGKVRKAGVARLAAYTAGFLALHAFARSIADEDEGGNQLDQLSSFKKMSAFNFIADDTVYSIPLAFGLPRLAQGIALNAWAAGSGEKTVSESAANLVGDYAVPAFSPIQASDISAKENPFQFLIATFAPTVLQAPIEVGMNMTSYGSPLKPLFPKQDEFWSAQGRKGTAQFWKDTARSIRELGGPDFTPEEVRHLGQGYALGIFRHAMNHFIENPNKERKGQAYANPLIAPFVSPTASHGVTAQYYEARDRLLPVHKERQAILAKAKKGEGSANWRSQMTDEQVAQLRVYDKMTEAEDVHRKAMAAIGRLKVSEASKDRKRHEQQQKRRREIYRWVAQLREAEGKTVGAESSFKVEPYYE